jgi:hypothetical protein
MAVEIQAESGETSIVIFENTAGDPMSRLSSDGSYITAVQFAPTNLEVGECGWWYDPSTNSVFFRARKTSMGYWRGSVSLTLEP